MNKHTPHRFASLTTSPPLRRGEETRRPCFIVATPGLLRLAIVKERTSIEVGRTGGRSVARFNKQVRPCGRPSGGLALSGAAMTLKAPIKARTWGLITQPHTVMRPIRHRRPSLIPGAHQVSRKGDGTDYGGDVEWVDKWGGIFFERLARTRCWAVVGPNLIHAG